MLKRAIAALALAATTGGCMQYLVQPPQPSLAGTPQTVRATAKVDGDIPNPGTPETAKATGYLGGKVQKPGYVTAERCQHGEQLARVLVKRNFWQGLVNWITLGMVAPATVEYSCANVGEPPMGGGSA